MAYDIYVEICGRCGSLVTWDANGDSVCECGNTLLDFIVKQRAIEIGILKGG